MKVHISSFWVVLVSVCAAFVFSVGVCAVTAVRAGLFTALPWGPRDAGPREVAGDPPVPRNTPLETRASASAAPAPAAVVHAANGSTGRAQYLRSCASCHGQQGLGMPHQGPPLSGSPFVARTDDDGLVAFIKRGRMPTDPQTVMRLYMPPLGGNLALRDADVAEIVAHVREMQHMEVSRAR